MRIAVAGAGRIGRTHIQRILYDRYGEADAPAWLAAQALLDRPLGGAITELRG